MKLNEIDYSVLDPKEIGSWPLVLRVVIAVTLGIVTIILTYIFYLTPKIELIQKQKTALSQKMDDFRVKYTKAHNIDGYEAQLEGLNSSYERKLKQMPPAGNIPELIDSITRLAQKNNLQISSIKLGDPNPENGFYQSLALNLDIVGSYHNIGQFLSSISKLPRIVTLHEFTLKKGDRNREDGIDQLLLTLLIKTYWLASDQGSADGSSKDAKPSEVRSGRRARPAVVEAQ